MSLNPEDGARYAQQLARAHTALYQEANSVYGKLIAQFCEDFPKAFVLGHLTRVNPTLVTAPLVTSDRRRGFLYAPFDTLSSIDVKWENLDDPTTCAYVWGYDINLHAQQLYAPNEKYFPKPNTDFWRSVYLRHVLGRVPFEVIWEARNTRTTPVYNSLLYVVNSLRRGLPGWPLIKLKRTVFFDCAYSYELALQGGTTTTEGFGRFPVLQQTDLARVFE
jgi:hypothetical protein